MPLPPPGSSLFLLCRRCDYSLEGIPDSQLSCPECGTEIPRFPATPTFTCEPAASPPPRRTNPIAMYAGFGAIGFGVLVWQSLRKPRPDYESLVVVGAIFFMVILAMLWVVRRWSRVPRGMRITVNIPARMFRFENCTITAHLGLPRSTGDGLDLSFDQVRSAVMRTTELAGLLILSTTRGRIVLTDRLTNFHALTAIALDIARPHPGYSWKLFILIIVPFTAILLGIGFYFAYR